MVRKLRGELKAIFVVQDEITRQVVTSLEVQLTPEEQQRIWRRQTSDVEAYRAVLQGRERYLRFTRSDSAEAQKLYEKALTLAPDFATAWAFLGSTHAGQARYQWVEDTDAAWARATEAAKKAVAIDDSNPYALSSLANIEEISGRSREGSRADGKGGRLCPSDAK